MKKVYVFLLILFSCGMIASFCFLLSWNHENQETKNIVLKEEKHVVQKEDVMFLDPAILKDNPDTIGWITIEGTSIHYPVLQSQDNAYYLTHDFSKKDNSAGWIFMDYRNQLNDQNIILYGHHRKDGTMFGSMDLLFQKSFYEEYPNQILFITLKEKRLILFFRFIRQKQTKIILTFLLKIFPKK